MVTCRQSTVCLIIRSLTILPDALRSSQGYHRGSTLVGPSRSPKQQSGIDHKWMCYLCLYSWHYNYGYYDLTLSIHLVANRGGFTTERLGLSRDLIDDLGLSSGAYLTGF